MRMYIVKKGEVWESSSVEFICSTEQIARSRAVSLLQGSCESDTWIVADANEDCAYWTDNSEFIAIFTLEVDAIESETERYVEARIKPLLAELE